jgi:hypothetical protein
MKILLAICRWHAIEKAQRKKEEERSSSAAGSGQTTIMCIWACWVGRAISAGKVHMKKNLFYYR